ncbi:hypothetical protein CMK11_04130 [Candidatus Poribacteria bacterium]|nr:hypothetical protein [Candidatus Poribacteria bacterium]
MTRDRDTASIRRRIALVALLAAPIALCGAPARAVTGDGIAYVQGGSIWYLDAGAPVRLTDDAFADTSPSW